MCNTFIINILTKFNTLNYSITLYLYPFCFCCKFFLATLPLKFVILAFRDFDKNIYTICRFIINVYVFFIEGFICLFFLKNMVLYIVILATIFSLLLINKSLIFGSCSLYRTIFHSHKTNYENSASLFFLVVNIRAFRLLKIINLKSHQHDNPSSHFSLIFTKLYTRY